MRVLCECQWVCFIRAASASDYCDYRATHITTITMTCCRVRARTPFVCRKIHNFNYVNCLRANICLCSSVRQPSLVYNVSAPRLTHMWNDNHKCGGFCTVGVIIARFRCCFFDGCRCCFPRCCLLLPMSLLLMTMFVAVLPCFACCGRFNVKMFVVIVVIKFDSSWSLGRCAPQCVNTLAEPCTAPWLRTIRI